MASPTARPRGALLALPVIVLNMGAEMVYILHQRLKAQNIPGDKSKKVLVDVIKNMFKPAFIEEMFRPQEAYTVRATRQVFDKLAHSSIMRLNKQSMDKLFDLMAMGFKYQVLCTTSPSHILQVTLNHLDQLKSIVGDEPISSALLADAYRRCVDTYLRLPISELFALRHTLARFVQDRHVKVSLFLEDGLQLTDGTIVLKFNAPGQPLPLGTEQPGTIRYFSHDGKQMPPLISASTSASAQSHAHGGGSGGGSGAGAGAPVERIAALAQLYHGCVSVQSEGNPLDANLRACKLGGNMYLKERKRKGNGVADDAAASKDAASTTPTSPADPFATEPMSKTDAESKDDGGDDVPPGLDLRSPGKDSSAGNGPGSAVKAGHGLAAVNLLATLLGGGGAGAAAHSSAGGAGSWNINLFGDDGGFMSSSLGDNDGLDGDRNGNGIAGNVVKLGSGGSAGKAASNAATMMAALGLNDEDGASDSKRDNRKADDGKADEGKDGDDLLDLMDQLG